MGRADERIWSQAVETILAALGERQPAPSTPVVLIDGRSGSGKSTVAGQLAAEIPGSQLVRLDDLYPGWDGLDAGSLQVVTSVFDAVNPGWVRWDWQADAAAECHSLDAARPLIVEGCGALSRAAREKATLGVWIECPEPIRKRRALDRDGETYAPHWDRWAEQESRFIAREHPQTIADLVITEGEPISG
ncbi:AAA family ATPase [Salinibacterium hongtaonis]|uniref:AAA family ATPase n=1 Tax=Homoserinimonas hongtaonis TaxID=2079791 RepID=UPI001E32D372|nr:AAA family ATPase [Salinibacterium hongtaonis]